MQDGLGSIGWMLSLLARLVIAAPKRVLAAVLYHRRRRRIRRDVSRTLGAAGFQDPDSPSAKGIKVLTSTFGQGDMDLTLVVRAPGGVQDPAVAAAGRILANELRRAEFVKDVESPWDGSPQSAGLIGKDGKTGLVVAGITGSENDAPKHAKTIAEKFAGKRNGLEVLAGGTATVASEINDQSEKDLVVSEAIALPLSLIVLVWVFGGFFAALLPLVVGGLAIVGTLGMLRVITLFADVSIFSLDLTTAMGLAWRSTTRCC